MGHWGLRVLVVFYCGAYDRYRKMPKTVNLAEQQRLGAKSQTPTENQLSESPEVMDVWSKVRISPND